MIGSTVSTAINEKINTDARLKTVGKEMKEFPTVITGNCEDSGIEECLSKAKAKTGFYLSIHEVVTLLITEGGISASIVAKFPKIVKDTVVNDLSFTVEPTKINYDIIKERLEYFLDENIRIPAIDIERMKNPSLKRLKYLDDARSISALYLDKIGSWAMMGELNDLDDLIDNEYENPNHYIGRLALRVDSSIKNTTLFMGALEENKFAIAYQELLLSFIEKLESINNITDEKNYIGVSNTDLLNALADLVTSAIDRLAILSQFEKDIDSLTRRVVKEFTL